MDQNPPPDEPDRDEPESQPGAPPPGTPGGGWQPPAPPGPPPPPPAQPAPPGGWQPQSPAPQAPPPQAPAGYPPPPPSYPVSGYPQTARYPEGTYEGYTLASWGSRVGAALLDGLITLIPITVGIGLTIAGVESVGVILLVLGFVGSFLYGPFFMQRDGERNGQTLGKQVVDIKVIRENREPFSFGQGLMREFVIKALLVGVVGSFIPFGSFINYLWPLWDEQNRALHDFVASTRVVAA